MIKKCLVGIHEKKRTNIIHATIVINIYRSAFLYPKNIFRVKCNYMKTILTFFLCNYKDLNS